MTTVFSRSYGDCLLENDCGAAVFHMDPSPVERSDGNPLMDELDAELKDLGGDCVKVMQLLKADSSLLKYRALAVLHLGVSRGCVKIVEQVVKFCNGEGRLGDSLEPALEKEGQAAQSSTEEEIDTLSGNNDSPSFRTKADKKTPNSGPDPSCSQDHAIQVAQDHHAIQVVVDSRTSEHLLLLRKRLALLDSEADQTHPRPVLDFNEFLTRKYLYSGPPREFDALAVAIVNGNLDVLALLLTQTTNVPFLELPRNQLRKITERVVESIKEDSVSSRICQSVFDALQNDREFNFLFWDFDPGKERVSEYLFHFLVTKQCQSVMAQHIRLCLWQEIREYQSPPGEEPLWQSLLKLHDA